VVKQSSGKKMGEYKTYAEKCIQRFKKPIEERTGTKLENLIVQELSNHPVIKDCMEDYDITLMMTVPRVNPSRIFIIEENYRKLRKPLEAVAEGIVHEMTHLAHKEIVEEMSVNTIHMSKRNMFQEGFAMYMALDHMRDLYTEKELKYIDKERESFGSYKEFKESLKPYGRGYKFFRKILGVIGDDNMMELVKNPPSYEIEMKFPLLYLLNHYPGLGFKNFGKFVSKARETRKIKKKKGIAPFDH